MWSYLDESYQKGSWYTQTFLCQLLPGCNKNQLFQYFGLVHDLLYRQELTNKCFEKRYSLNFLENVFYQVGFIVRISENFEMTLQHFGYQQFQFPVYELSLLAGVFFRQLLLKIQNDIDQELRPALHILDSLRGILLIFHQSD